MIFEVPAALAGERVDRAVALLAGWSRAEVQALLDQDEILVSGAAAGKSRRLREGERIEVLGEPPVPGPPTAEPMPIAVVAEDDDFVVVDKPAGLVVHPGAGHPGGTLVNGLLARYPELADVGDPMRPGIVHRLDRDTSGLLVVARTPRAYAALVAALAARAVQRQYTALVWGAPGSPQGVIDAPIGRSVRQPTRMAVRQGGRDARTRYEVEEQLGATSLLTCTLESGRTHQIRVHLAAIGHPVVGDPAYGGVRGTLHLDRPFLHAAVLGFEHPVSGEALRYESPLPRELADVLTELRG